MLPAESEPAQVVVTSLIHCHKQEETPTYLAAPEPEQTPEPTLEVPERLMMSPAELEPVQL